MVLLFVVALDFRTTGREAHEWAGLAFCLLLALHTRWNWSWYRNLFTGRYGARRAVNAVTNLALAAAMAAVCVCGILNSRHVFGFSHAIDGESVRRMHTVAAYWSLALIGVHTGLHWSMIMGAVRKRFGFGGTRRWAAVPARALVVILVGFGVWAFCERDMAAKLFLGFSFDFWPPDRPLALLYACNLAILGLYAAITHYLTRILQLVTRKLPLPAGKKDSARRLQSGGIHEHIV